MTSGQGASLKVTFQNGTSGITVSSVTMNGSSMAGSTTRNITVQNSTFTSHAIFNGLANSNVLFDNNTHNNIQGGGQFASPARIHLSYGGSTHSGVTIQNSLMDGGSADGVQTGVGVNIINNEFRNIHEGSCSDCHTDAIQLLGAADTVIRGNYIHDVSTAVVAFDRVTRAIIENNVIDTGGRPWGIELYADTDSIVRHNTLPYRANCAYNLPCGTITLDHKSADPAGRGTIIIDNIATSISTVNGSSYAQRHHNLVRSGAASGDIAGSPTYTGGSLPSNWEGFQSTSGSLGRGAASVPAGANVGADIAGSEGEPPTPQTPPAAPSNLRIARLPNLLYQRPPPSTWIDESRSKGHGRVIQRNRGGPSSLEDRPAGRGAGMPPVTPVSGSHFPRFRRRFQQRIASPSAEARTPRRATDHHLEAEAQIAWRPSPPVQSRPAIISSNRRTPDPPVTSR